jgi:hypothetical protein
VTVEIDNEGFDFAAGARYRRSDGGYAATEVGIGEITGTG